MGLGLRMLTPATGPEEGNEDFADYLLATLGAGATCMQQEDCAGCWLSAYDPSVCGRQLSTLTDDQ